MKMLRNVSEKLTAKFPLTTLRYTMVKIAHLKGAFSVIFELETSTVEGQSVPQKDKKGEKGKAKKKVQAGVNGLKADSGWQKSLYTP